MCDLFEVCIKLISLPDISKWNTSNITDMSFMFNKCNSLISLPDISKWNNLMLLILVGCLIDIVH